MLGVFLGSNDYQNLNWEGIVEKVCSKLSKWKWLLPQLSFRGRILVINNLVASTLKQLCYNLLMDLLRKFKENL